MVQKYPECLLIECSKSTGIDESSSSDVVRPVDDEACVMRESNDSMGSKVSNTSIANANLKVINVYCAEGVKSLDERERKMGHWGRLKQRFGIN